MQPLPKISKDQDHLSLMNKWYQNIYIILSMPILLVLAYQNYHLKKRLEIITRPKVNFESRFFADSPNAPSLGDKNAEITIIEFSDFDCIACRENAHIVDSLNELFPGQINWVYRHFPLSSHEDGHPTAMASMAAHAQGKFWKMRKELLLAKEPITGDMILQAAANSGVDLPIFEKDLANNKWKAQIEADIQAGLALGIKGLPAYFINGIKLESSRPKDLENLIIKLLEEN